jgi:hypothetical protein
MGKKTPEKVDPYSSLAEMIELRSKLARCVEILILIRATLDAHMIYIPGIDKVLDEVGKNRT